MRTNRTALHLWLPLGAVLVGSGLLAILFYPYLAFLSLNFTDLVVLWGGTFVVWFFGMYEFTEKELRTALDRLCDLERLGKEGKGAQPLLDTATKSQKGVVRFFAHPFQRAVTRVDGFVIGILPPIGFGSFALHMVFHQVVIGQAAFAIAFSAILVISVIETALFTGVFWSYKPGERYLVYMQTTWAPP